MAVEPSSFVLVVCWYVKGPATRAVREPRHARRSGGTRISAFVGLAGLGRPEKRSGAASVSGPGITGAAIVSGTVTASPSERSKTIACRGAPQSCP